MIVALSNALFDIRRIFSPHDNDRERRRVRARFFRPREENITRVIVRRNPRSRNVRGEWIENVPRRSVVRTPFLQCTQAKATATIARTALQQYPIAAPPHCDVTELLL